MRATSVSHACVSDHVAFVLGPTYRYGRRYLYTEKTNRVQSPVRESNIILSCSPTSIPEEGSRSLPILVEVYFILLREQ